MTTAVFETPLDRKWREMMQTLRINKALYDTSYCHKWNPGNFNRHMVMAAMHAPVVLKGKRLHRTLKETPTGRMVQQRADHFKVGVTIVNAFPVTLKLAHKGTKTDDVIDQDEILAYLVEHPNELEDFVMRYVNTLELIQAQGVPVVAVVVHKLFEVFVECCEKMGVLAGVTIHASPHPFRVIHKKEASEFDSLCQLVSSVEPPLPRDDGKHVDLSGLKWGVLRGRREGSFAALVKENGQMHPNFEKMLRSKGFTGKSDVCYTLDESGKGTGLRKIGKGDWIKLSHKSFREEMFDKCVTSQKWRKQKMRETFKGLLSKS